MIIGFKLEEPEAKVLYAVHGDDKHAVAMEIYGQMLQIWNTPGPFWSEEERDQFKALSMGYHALTGRWPPKPPTGPATWN